jgi:hypothetical protein
MHWIFLRDEYIEIFAIDPKGPIPDDEVRGAIARPSLEQMPL